MLAALEYEAETTFGEDVTTFATHRIPIQKPPDIGQIFHEKVDANRVIQYRNDRTQWITGVMGGSVKIRLWVTGHGATMVGSPTVDAIETFLALVLGGNSGAGDLSASASTTFTGGTAAVPTTTASGTFDAGGLCRAGVLGDGRGNGQFYAITTHTGTSLTLVGALDAAPNSGDVLFPVVQLYEPEAPTTTAVTGIRMRFLSGNLGYELHGCYPTACEWGGLNPGEVPWVEITYGVSWWRYTTATFPSTVTSNIYQPAPIAAGSLNVQDVGTTTRNKRTYRNLSLKHQLNVVPLPGPGGASIYQRYVGARRLPTTVEVSWTEDADTATLTPVLPGYGTATTFKHIEWTGSVTDGSAFGWKMPRAAITNVPIQKDDGGINRLMITAEAAVSTVTTNDRTLAAIVFGMA